MTHTTLHVLTVILLLYGVLVIVGTAFRETWTAWLL